MIVPAQPEATDAGAEVLKAGGNAVDAANRIPRGVQRELEAAGYEVVRSPYTFGFAAVHAIRVHADGLDGGADPGHDGIVLAVEGRRALDSLGGERARAREE